MSVFRTSRAARHAGRSRGCRAHAAGLRHQAGPFVDPGPRQTPPELNDVAAVPATVSGAAPATPLAGAQAASAVAAGGQRTDAGRAARARLGQALRRGHQGRDAAGRLRAGLAQGRQDLAGDPGRAARPALPAVGEHRQFGRRARPLRQPDGPVVAGDFPQDRRRPHAADRAEHLVHRPRRRRPGPTVDQGFRTACSARPPSPARRIRNASRC